MNTRAISISKTDTIERPSKSRLIAGMLGLVLGPFGFHRWYLGYRRLATIQFVATVATLGLAGIWGIIEGGCILAGIFKLDSLGRALSQTNASQIALGIFGSVGAHGGTILILLISNVYVAPSFRSPQDFNSIALVASIRSTPSPEEPVPIEVAPAPIPVDPPAAPEIHAMTPDTQQTEAVDIDLVKSEFGDYRFVKSTDSVPTSVMIDRHQIASSPRRDPERFEPNTEPEEERQEFVEQKIPRKEAELVQPTASTASLPSPASQQHAGQERDPPRKITRYCRPPVYPAECLRRRIEGRSLLKVRISAEGNVESASLLRTSGNKLLDEAALRAVRDWRFSPATEFGIPVQTTVAVPINFRIDD